PLNFSEVRRAARAFAPFRIGSCGPDSLRDLLFVLLEEEEPALAAKVRGLSREQVLALRADVAALLARSGPGNCLAPDALPSAYRVRWRGWAGRQAFRPTDRLRAGRRGRPPPPPARWRPRR